MIQLVNWTQFGNEKLLSNPAEQFKHNQISKINIYLVALETSNCWLSFSNSL